MTENKTIQEAQDTPNNQRNNQRNSQPNNQPKLDDKLKNVLDNAKFPDTNTVVTGALDEVKVTAIAKAGIDHIINLQAQDELSFDERAAVEAQGMTYNHLPIASKDELKQLNLLQLDRILRQYHGQKILLHCKTGGRVGACMALRAGWLRGRKMDTAIKTGQAYGLTDNLEEEVRNRLLVPR